MFQRQGARCSNVTEIYIPVYAIKKRQVPVTGLIQKSCGIYFQQNRAVLFFRKLKPGLRSSR
jgi:hypothetical protein